MIRIILVIDDFIVARSVHKIDLTTPRRVPSIVDNRGATYNIISGDQHNITANEMLHTIRVDLTSLPYAEGASWNPSHTCLESTRTALLEVIWDWIVSINIDPPSPPT